MYCSICTGRAPVASLLCLKCAAKAAPNRTLRLASIGTSGVAIPILSLARYRAEVAQLILRAKVQGDVRALMGLTRWLDEHADELRAFCANRSVIVAARRHAHRASVSGP